MEVQNQLGEAKVTSKFTSLVIRASAEGVEEIEFGEGKGERGEAISTGGRAQEIADQAAEEIKEYFEGERREFGVPLHWSKVYGFSFEVLSALNEVPFGETISYGELSRRAGKPLASRHVGRIMGQNPWPIVVPCHRVIHSDGSLGGYGGSPETKRQLLLMEQG